MGYDQAGVTRSLNTIQNELQYLASQGVIASPQMQSIQAQLLRIQTTLRTLRTQRQVVDIIVRGCVLLTSCVASRVGWQACAQVW